MRFGDATCSVLCLLAHAAPAVWPGAVLAAESKPLVRQTTRQRPQDSFPSADCTACTQP
jgi:hypothetical protein